MIINNEMIDKNDAVIKMLKIKISVKIINVKELNYSKSEDSRLYIINNIKKQMS